MSRLILDTLERTLAAYVTTFLGLVLADLAHVTDVSGWKAAAIAAIPAGLSVVKAAVGQAVGDKSTVGWVPKARP